MRVRFTPAAFRDLEQIFAYIDERSPQGAAHVKARIKEMIDVIARNPEIGVLAGSRGLRRTVAQPFPYLIFYRGGAAEIVIHGVRHGARSPSSMPR